jgi:hypothetical protein
VYQQNKKSLLLLIKNLDKIFILILTPKLSKMKKIKLTLSIIALSAVFSTTAVGQQSSSATAIAGTTVITPILIAKVLDLNFGIFSTGTTAGTIVLTPAAGAVPTASSGIKIISKSIPTAAKFVVSGTDDYSITLPLTITLTGTTPGNTMTISNFTSNVAAGAGKLTTLSETVYVGGTLNIPINTLSDVYSNLTDLTVMVNYK